jgi:hypothetical protein
MWQATFFANTALRCNIEVYDLQGAAEVRESGTLKCIELQKDSAASKYSSLA